MKRTLRPIIHRDRYTKAVELHVIDYFHDVIFGPIFQIMEEANLDRENAASTELIQAIMSGRVWYSDGVFSGEFNAAISRELRAMGAKKYKTDGLFHLEQGKVPLDVRGALYASRTRSRKLHDDITTILDHMQANIPKAPTGLDIGNTIDKVVMDLQKQFVSTVSGTDSISVAAQLTPGIEKKLREGFTENLDLSIQKFALQEIPKLRQKVQANAFAGYRADKLAQIIQAQYGVTESKAEFLAEQETSLLVSKFRQSRYEEIGCTQYKWSTSHDERVRPDHAKLNGDVFSFDLPPITNSKTGDRNNPGEDWRCRCVAIPIVTFDD